ncbi:hypothetical protein ES703_52390 [subsurface metagenome]
MSPLSVLLYIPLPIPAYTVDGAVGSAVMISIDDSVGRPDKPHADQLAPPSVVLNISPSLVPK